MILHVGEPNNCHVVSKLREKLDFQIFTCLIMWGKENQLAFSSVVKKAGITSSAQM